MIKKRLKPVYLLFFAIPLLYVLLWHFNSVEPADKTKQNDFLSFSLKTSNPSVISLTSDKKNLATWEITNNTFKNLQYAGPLNNIEGISIVVQNPGINDTISFLGFHLYRNNQLYSLYDYTIENAIVFENDGIFKATVKNAGNPVVIKFKTLSQWQTVNSEHQFLLKIFLLFIIVFIFLIAFAPPKKYFIISVFISLFAMILFYVADLDFSGRVSVSNDSQLKGVEVFYNNKPIFNPYKKYNSLETKNTYSFPLNLSAEEFLRFDIVDTASLIDGFRIKIKTGIFYSTFNLASIPKQKLVLNDILINGSHVSIRGNDPYFVLASTYFVGKIKWLLFLEKNIFLFLTLLVFIVFLIVRPFLERCFNFKCHWIHLWFLLIPLTFYLITKPWKKEPVKASADCIYFSARSSAPSLISLFNGSDSITSWPLNSPAFKYLQYSGNIKDFSNLYFKVNGLSANDTLSLLSVNFFHQGHVYSIFNKNEPVCTIKNATKFDKQEGAGIVAQNNNT